MTTREKMAQDGNASKTLRIKNWDRWQSYRRDRGQPPWIKIHRRLMRNLDWIELTDAQRGQLIAIWLLAADHDGVISADPEIIRKMCFMQTDPDINLFIEKGFIDAKAASRRRQKVQISSPNDEPKAEAKAETEAEEIPTRGNGATAPLSDRQAAFENYNSTAEYLKLAAARGLTKDRQRKLDARLKEVGLNGWNLALENLMEMPFCYGQNDRGWKVTFDWMLSPTNLNKLIEKQYAREERDDTDAHTSRQR